MKQSIARGYIKKTKDITNHKSITNNTAAYKGTLKIGKENIIVEVYSDEENFKNQEIFVKLSTDKVQILDRIL